MKREAVLNDEEIRTVITALLWMEQDFKDCEDDRAEQAEGARKLIDKLLYPGAFLSLQSELNERMKDIN